MGRSNQAMSKALSRENIVTECKDNKSYRNKLKYRGLTLVEVYSRTWGACTCIFPKLQNLYKDLMDRPIQLVSVECDDVPQLAEYVGRSMPVFLLYKKNQLLEGIEGVNSPHIERLVHEHAPSKDELANTQDEPESEDDTPAASSENTGKRRPSISKGLGRRRSIVK